MLDRNVSDIINLHEYAAEFVGKPISVFDSVKIAKAILELNLLPAKLDIGKLTYEYGLEEDKYPDAKYFVIDKLKTQKTQRKFNRKMLYCMVLDALVVYCQRINV
jgi:glyceraldehyde 3-phosphate dehydrogenase